MALIDHPWGHAIGKPPQQPLAGRGAREKAGSQES